MVTVLLNEDEKRQTVHGTAYRYDQANRIKKSNVFTGVVNNSFEDATDNNYYKTTHNYDLNGNITQLNRYNDAGVWMDSLNYQYKNDGNGLYQSNGGFFTPGYDYRDGTFTGVPSVSNANKNQLTRVIDGKGVVNTTDFPGTSADNYLYDNIGQLIKDNEEHIDTILWDVYGKVKEIRYYDSGNLERPDILFKYDPSGNRIAKILKTKEADGSIKTANHWDYYYYLRDASGNTMAVYQQDITHLSGNEYQSTLTLLERNIYGSSRLGADNQQVVSISKFFATFTTSGGTTTTGTANYPTSSVVEVSGGGNITITDPSMEDLHLTIQALDNDVTLFAQNINVISGSLSYSPEGMLMLPAHQQAEITCGYELELMNGGTPVNIQPMNSNTLTYTAANTINITPLFNFNKKQRTIGKKVYEKSNHLGNVLVTFSDRKFPMKIAELNYHWNFENTDDSEVNGSGLDPVTNTATYVSSVGYDGSDVIETNTGDYVEFADDARLDFGTRDFTVAVWAKKISQLNYGNSVVSKWNTGGSPGTNEWTVSLNGGISGTTNGPSFSVEIGTTSYSAKKATPVTNTGQWYFLVGKREGNTISIYVNGVLEDTETIPTGASINNISGREMKIGAIDASGVYSNMQVDNLMIFDNALSDDQIAEMYSGNLYSYYEPDVKSYSDYYPGGFPLPGRHTVQTSSDYDANGNRVYRYGYQGSEKDFEITNVTGAHITTFFREFDTRLNRTWSNDPVFQPWQSPYTSMDNNPILYNDPMGDCPTCPTDGKAGDTHEWGGSTFTNDGNGNWSTNLDEFEVSSTGVNSVSSNPSISNNNSTGVTYSKADLEIRNNIRSLSINNPLRRGLEANERNGVFRRLHDPSAPYGKEFQKNWDLGYEGMGETAKFWMNATAVGVGGALTATLAVPALVQGGASAITATYDGALTGAAHIYFRWQVYAGTVSGTGTGGILLGRNMKLVSERANQIGFGYLRMPSFVQWGNRTQPMLHYNRLWLNYHLQSGSNVSVMTNALGKPTFYSPAYGYSPFMDMELRMLMRFYGGK